MLSEGWQVLLSHDQSSIRASDFFRKWISFFFFRFFTLLSKACEFDFENDFQFFEAFHGMELYTDPVIFFWVSFTTKS